jgi:peptide/nickel transport system permease protein
VTHLPSRKSLLSQFLVPFERRSAKVGAAILVVFFILILIGPFLVPYSPNVASGKANAPPSLDHPFGTDFLGKDVLSEVIYGAYPSMLVGIAAALGATLVGLIAGVMAGYFNRLEGWLTGTTDIVMTFPPIPFMVLLGSIYYPSQALIVLILVVVLWPPIARSIRSQIMTVKKLPYVDAARTSGMKDRQIIMGIMLPEVTAIAVAYFVLVVAAAIVLVAALEFIGVGHPDVVSWGSMLYWAQSFAFYNGDWWWILAPGVSITLVATGFALIGFSIEEVMNPRLIS